MPCALSRRVLSGGFYSQYKANLPCLQGLLDLDRGESAEASPLADQARKILRDMGVELTAPTKLYVDNQGAVELSSAHSLLRVRQAARRVRD